MDKLKLYPQERLDLVDINDIQALVYAYAQKSLGNLMGGMRGLLSRPLYTFVNGTPDKIQLSDFSFISTKAIGNAAGTNSIKVLQESQIVHFDSTLADHGNYPIDLTGVDNTMFLWVRPLMVDMDSANRRKWDVAQGTEVTFNDNTRTRMRCEFAFSATDPTSEEDEYQYSQIAKVASITGSSIILSFISAFDNASIADTIGETGTFYDSLSTTTTAFSGLLGLFSAYDAQNEYNQGLGFAQIVHILARALRQHKFEGVNDPVGTSKTVPWYNQPLLSLNGAYKYLTNHDTEISNLDTAKNTLVSRANRYDSIFFSRGAIPFAWCRVVGNPKNSSNIWSIQSGSFSNIYVDPTYPNIFSLIIPSNMQSEQWYVNSVSIEQKWNPTTTGTHTKNHNRSTVEFKHFSTTTNDSAWFVAGAGYNCFTFEMIPHYLADEDNFDNRAASNDYNVLSTAQITYLITFFGAPANA